MRGGAGGCRDAARCAIDYVNLHGTGDARQRCGGGRWPRDSGVRAGHVPCSSTKGWIGHTLGASGIVGAVIASLAIEYGFLPGCLGMRTPDPAFRARVPHETERRPVRRVAVNSFGFGGSNCSLLLGAA